MKGVSRKIGVIRDGERVIEDANDGQTRFVLVGKPGAEHAQGVYVFEKEVTK